MCGTARILRLEYNTCMKNTSTMLNPGRSAYLEKGRGPGRYSNLKNADTFFKGLFARKCVGKTPPFREIPVEPRVTG